jgi:PAS domain S-box-containing protein
MSALQFLLLEANLPDAEVVQAKLREGKIDCELLRVDTRAAFIRALESKAIDLILADYALSNFDGIAALAIARRLRPEIPFIFISGSLGEELAIEAIKQGATDYVLKQRLGRLVPSVQRALQEVLELDKDTIDRKQAQVTLRESEAKYRSLCESIGEGYALIELIYDEAETPVNWRLLEVNPSFERLTGFSNAVGKTSDELYQVPNANWLEAFGTVAQMGEPIRFEQYVSGVDYWFDLHVSRLDADRRHLIVVFNNITERKQAEAQLRRAAEMDGFRVKLSDALRSLSDPVEIQAEACRLLGEHLGVDRAYYVEVNEVESYARVNQDYLRGNSPTLVGTFRLVDYGWIVPHLRRGETIIVTDADNACKRFC